MHISARTVVVSLIGLAKLSSALPDPNNTASAVPEIINSTDAAIGNHTDGFTWLEEPTRARRARLHSRALAKRDGLAPRERSLKDHMENYGQDLPECYKTCMRKYDGKAQIHMAIDPLGKICGVKWPLFAWWTEHHLWDCINAAVAKGGCKKEEHRAAYRWLKWTCGDKPN